MFSFRRCLLVLLILFAAPAPAATGDSAWFYRGSDIPPDPAWQFGTLTNGVRYAVRRNALPAGQVSIRVRIDTGSLNEADNERGWAHFVEHLVFRGTRSFGDREARHIWQQLGASFGSDTNASTDISDTVYQLDLPRNDQAALDQSFKILSEMVDAALIDSAAVEAERKIVLAEKRRRPEISTRIDELSRPLFYAGLKYAERDPIGTEDTLAAATAPGLRAFYERWYRPERATLIVAGDADPAMLIALIEKNFSAWQGTGPAPAEPDYGSIRKPKDRATTLAYPGAPYGASLVWLRPHVDAPDTIARTRDQIAEALATQILNRRLEAKARGEAAFLSAGAGIGRTRRVADITQISLTAKDGQWRQALNETFAIIADAQRRPPSEAEIARELSNIRNSLTSAVAEESTVRSPQRAQQLVAAIDSGEVVTSAPSTLAMFDTIAPTMTPARVEAALKGLFGTGPRLLLLTPQAVEGGAATVATALATAEKAAPAQRQADRAVSFADLPALGDPGKEVSRQRIEDLGVTIVRFSNGSTLTFRQSDYEKGLVLVELRFGSGTAGLPSTSPTSAWLAGIVASAGFADLDLDAIERLMTGRRMNLNFGIDEDAYELTGTTNAADLPDQLRVLAIKLAYPRWDPALFNRYKASALENYDMSFASATARGGREFGGVVHPGDQRWMPIDKPRMAAATANDVPAMFGPVLASGPVEAIIVGDVDLESAVSAMARTIGALPDRPPPQPLHTAGVAPPRPDPRPRTFTHTGDPSQAYAVIGWSTFGGTERIRERRALSLAANILQVRLFDRLREEEGATYSPSAANRGSESFPDWGIFLASAEIRPESADTFFRIAREEVAKLAATPASADEFARAQNPIVNGIQRRIKTNGYWLAALENWTRNPALIEQTRSYLSDYSGLTAEQVRAAVAAYVADEGDWSMLVVPEKAIAKASEPKPDGKAGVDGK